MAVVLQRVQSHQFQYRRKARHDFLGVNDSNIPPVFHNFSGLLAQFLMLTGGAFL